MIDRSHLSTLLSDDLSLPEDCESNLSDDSLLAVACKSLRRSFLKKLEPEGGLSKEQMSEGERLFLLYNDKCLNWQLPAALNEVEVTILGEFSRELYDFFQRRGEPLIDLAAISEHGNLGPGANVDAQSYNFYSKLFDSRLTATNSHLFRLYRSMISGNPLWAEAEKVRSLSHGDEIVDGSSLFHVPKDQTRTRTAATEPTLNMFLQKGIGALIEDRLNLVFGISLARQPEINRLLARRGSRDGSFGTIDLRSASDCIALGMCEKFLPRDVYSWLVLTRSPMTSLPGGRQVQLGLMSSMGNGFTFPLQTALFACLVRACYIVKGVTPERCGSKPENYGVFGDDIIVRKDCFDIVCRMLTVLGFEVNDSKSFNVGHFRESCGGDFWKGHDVRGVYLKKLNTQADLFSIINRLARWSARWMPLYKTIAYLRSGVEREYYVPLHEADDSGYKVSTDALRFVRSVRWDRKQGQWVYKALVPAPYLVRLRQPENDFEVLDTENFGLWYLNRLIVRRSSSVRKGKPIVHPPVHYNGPGMEVSFLGGFITHGTMTLRKQSTTYKVATRRTSSWDSACRAGWYTLGGEWQFIIDGLLN